MSETMMTVTNMCPECKQGKHYNCTITVLNTNDEWRKCPCLAEGHAPVTPYDGGTSSGHSGSDTSQARSESEDSNGTTAERQRRIINYALAQGHVGVTVKEVRDQTRLHHGQASSVLSVLHKQGLLARLSETRDRCKVYVLPAHVNGRETEPHGRQATAKMLAQVALESEHAELETRVRDYLDEFYRNEEKHGRGRMPWPADLAEFVGWKEPSE